jgi:lysophospholipase L1-like esterase
MMLRRLALACALLLLPMSARAAPVWMESWAASPAAPTTPADGATGTRYNPAFDNQTLVQVVRLSAGGRRLRIRFTNEYGRAPLAIGAARVGVLGQDGRLVAGSKRVLVFGGKTSVTLPAGKPLLSDPVDLAVTPLSSLRIGLYLPGAVRQCTCHVTGGQHLMISPPGDYTERPFASVDPGRPDYRAFLSAVDVESRTAGPVIVALGDSITDGYKSTDDANRRWPDRLAEHLIASAGGRPVAVVNAGISGNRLLADGFIPPMGTSALARFDRDVLAVPGVTHLIILEGVNDLGAVGIPLPGAERMINAYRQLIERAHGRGIKVIGATILPYEGSWYFHPEGEAVRQAVNRWIRTGGGFDRVIDFDALMRDPRHPARLKADLQAGDWLHPNDAGYKTMGDAVDFRLFDTKR